MFTAQTHSRQIDEGCIKTWVKEAYLCVTVSRVMLGFWDYVTLIYTVLTKIAENLLVKNILPALSKKRRLYTAT